MGAVRRRRVLLYGFFGIANSGNEAMLQAFVEPIRKHYGGDIDFLVANRHPSRDYDRRYGVTSIQNLEHETRDQATGRWLRGLNPDDSPHFMSFVNEVAAADLVVVGPGQYLVETGEYGLLKGALAQLATVVLACELTGVPSYGLALACEPLKSRWSKLVVRKALSQFKQLTFRDPQSVQNLEAAGISPPTHRMLGDLALAAEGANPKHRQEVLAREDIPPKRGPRLAVALRSIYWLGIDEDELRKRLAEVLALWLESHPLGDVLMIPQNVYHVDGDRDDDRVANGRVRSLLRDDLAQRVYAIYGDYGPEAIESLYGGCDVTLSARLHGAVFSCKQGTPPVVLTFMDKTKGFFRRISHTECMVPLESSSNEIFARLQGFVEDRDRLSASLLQAVARARSVAREYPAIAINLLERTPEVEDKLAKGRYPSYAADDVRQ